MSKPDPVGSAGAASTEASAEAVVDAWEAIEQEFMRDGHRATLEMLIRNALDRVGRERERAALERAAKVAESVEGPYQIGEGTPCACGAAIAASIRALLGGE